MEATTVEIRERAEERLQEDLRREDELATLAAHLNAATARLVELAWRIQDDGRSDDPAAFFAYRSGMTLREARECLRVAEALQELPVIRAAFSRGELTLTKVRALTRVATAASEEGLLELAELLTASQLERALRAFRRVAEADVRETHELEYVDYHFEENGSLYLPLASLPRTARCSSRRWRRRGSACWSAGARSRLPRLWPTRRPPCLRCMRSSLRARRG